nr:hypothetical protein [Bacteroidota bacterium]
VEMQPAGLRLKNVNPLFVFHFRCEALAQAKMENERAVLTLFIPFDKLADRVISHCISCAITINLRIFFAKRPRKLPGFFYAYVPNRNQVIKTQGPLLRSNNEARSFVLSLHFLTFIF